MIDGEVVLKFASDEVEEIVSEDDHVNFVDGEDGTRHEDWVHRDVPIRTHRDKTWHSVEMCPRDALAFRDRGRSLAPSGGPERHVRCVAQHSLHRPIELVAQILCGPVPPVWPELSDW